MKIELSDLPNRRKLFLWDQRVENMKASTTRRRSAPYTRDRPEVATEAATLPVEDANSSSQINCVVRDCADGKREVVGNLASGDQPSEGSSGENPTESRGASQMRLLGVTNAEIARYERCTELVIPPLTFQRVVRDIMKPLCSPNDPVRIEAGALAILQDAAETHITSLFVDGSISCVRRKGKELYPRDLALARKIRGNNPHFLPV
ncbi:histone H3.1 [Orchesella cincta]|uniref:Histone H3.1 n=1 Tax=Orchesella cincta TaxID=48709 RepID=A0A1D2MLH1_ORCCI|nr:histone H3.1 [Orchesella cincta]